MVGVAADAATEIKMMIRPTSYRGKWNSVTEHRSGHATFDLCRSRCQDVKKAADNNENFLVKAIIILPLRRCFLQCEWFCCL